jgi:hypothetical protein
VNVTQYHMSKRELAGTDELYIRNIATVKSMVKENKSILIYSILFYSILFYSILFYYRSYSDSVLVACLALLRRLASYITLDVSEKFVQNSLVDSFKEFRTSHESFV